MTKVVYEALQPRYVAEVCSSFYLDGAPGLSDWEQDKGFRSLELAKAYADDEKRNNPTAEIRVVDTQP